MERVLHCLTMDHDLWLVLLAGAICIVGAASTMIVANRALGTRITPLWLALLSVSAGATVWATHFIAMLAYRTGLPVTYGIGLTALSFLTGVLVMGLGLAVAIRWHEARAVRLLGGTVMGAGVVLLHYIGMAALRVPGALAYHTDLAAASVLLSLVFGALGLDLALKQRRGALLAGGALFVAMTLSLHFTAMGAVHLSVDVVPGAADGGMSRRALAAAVTVASLIVLLIGFAGAIVERRVERSLRTAAARFQALADGAFEALIVHRGGVITDANAAALKIFERERDTGPRSMEDWFGRTMAFELQGEARPDLDATAEIELKRPDGTPFPAEVRRRRILLADDSEGELLAIRDLTARKASEDRIAHLARHDTLTDLPNRRFFTELANDLLARAQHNDVPRALLVVDIDDFKAINDMHGQSVGDEVIRVAARRVASALGRNDVVARFGGDELVILQVADDQPRAAILLAQHLLRALAEPTRMESAELAIGVSIGIARHPDDGTTTEALVRNADTAMYRAKSDGKGTYRLFAPEMDAALDARRRFESRMRHAVAEERFTLAYQPIVDAKTRELLGFEALLRWHDEQLGWVSPADCIPVAEETGLIIPIGELVLRRACLEAATWPAPLRVAVNLSAIQLKRAGLVDAVRAALDASGLPGHRLELEITETALLDNRDETLRVLGELKALGARIAMDDFGTGYSSLGYLQSFPFDKIKIDRLFVSNLEQSPQAASIVQAITSIGNSLRMRVVAEGVETNAQANMLEDLACHELQGYLISKPLASDAVLRFLERLAQATQRRPALLRQAAP